MADADGVALVIWSDDQVSGRCAAYLRQRLGMLPTEAPLSLTEVVAHQPILDACRIPDQRVVLSASIGVFSFPPAGRGSCMAIFSTSGRFTTRHDGKLVWSFGPMICARC